MEEGDLELCISFNHLVEHQIASTLKA